MLFGWVCMCMYATVSLSAAARRQLQRYLSVQDGDHKAHQLMGQVCVEQERVAQALTHFRRSLEIKGDQPELVLIGGCVTCCHAPILHPFLSSTHYSAPPPLSRPTLHPCPALPSLPCIHLIPPTTPLFCSPLLNPTPPLHPPFQHSTPLTFLPLFCPTPLSRPVAELYCKLPVEDVPVHQLEEWLERVMEVAPYSTAVVSLKEAVLKAKGEEDTDALEELLTTQVLL